MFTDSVQLQNVSENRSTFFTSVDLKVQVAHYILARGSSIFSTSLSHDLTGVVGSSSLWQEAVATRKKDIGL